MDYNYKVGEIYEYKGVGVKLLSIAGSRGVIELNNQEIGVNLSDLKNKLTK